MRSVLIGLAALLCVTSAQSQTSDEVAKKVCILQVAGKLPNIPGLTIVASRATPATGIPNAGPNDLLIEIDVRVAALEVTYQGVCVSRNGVAVGNLVGVAR
jgi:hypothetical protein